MSNPSDDAILADFRERHRKGLRRALITMILVFFYVAAFSFFWGVADRYGWLTRYGIHSSWLFYGEFLPILLWGILSSRKVEKGPRLDLLPERILRSQIDHYQRRWRQVIQFLLLLLVVSAVAISLSFVKASAFDRSISTGWLVFCAILCALAAIRYPGLKVFDDERMRALRDGAAKAGFVGLLFALCAAVMTVLPEPHITAQETRQALIWLITTGGAIPALYYVIADWRAGRDG